MSRTRRETLLGLAGLSIAGGLGLGPRAVEAADYAPGALEPEGKVDTRFGSGNLPDGRAILPLRPMARRVWLDTQRTSGDGRSPDSAFPTPEQAYGRLRPGDQLMIAGGSRLTVPLGELRELPGHSPEYPTVIQSYDCRAPDDEARYGLISNDVVYAGPRPMWQAILTQRGKAGNVAMRGLRFDHRGQPMVSYSTSAGCDALLIEQCAFLGAMLSVRGRNPDDFHVIRQSAFFGQWHPVAHAQGMYLEGSRTEVIEDCVFDHCGWRPGAPRSTPAKEGGPTIFNHAVYAAVKTGGVMRRCVILDPASHGAQLRGDWISHDNVFIACPIALVHGQGTNYARDAPDGVTAHAYRTIVTVAEDISPKSRRAFGIEVANTRPGSLIEQALFVGPGRENANSALAAAAFTGPGYEPNRTEIRFARNTNLWSTRGANEGTRWGLGWPGRVKVQRDDQIDPGDGVRFVDPRRSGITAARALGVGGLDGLGAVMIANPGRPWAKQIADHIRPGYAPLPASRVKVRNADGTIRGAVLPDGRWNDGRPFAGWR